MIIFRRRNQKFKNLISVIRLHPNANWLLRMSRLQLSTALNLRNSIMVYFLLEHLISNFKVPNVRYKKFKTRFGLQKSNNKSLRLEISNFLKNKILNYLMFWLPYRAYPFKEALFLRTNSKISLFFIKLPINARASKLEEINSGEAINFTLDVIGFLTYIEYIYLMNCWGFIDWTSSCNESCFDNWFKTKKIERIHTFDQNDFIINEEILIDL